MNSKPMTDRAIRYLATLQRVPTIPGRDVEKILADQGQPSFMPWLDFHERYAGYVEPLGADTAIWGLVHEQSYWIAPRRVRVTREVHEPIWYIACAEVHPSYQYLLDSNGEFLGVPAESFDIKVERNALRWEFASRPGVAQLRADEVPQLAPLDFARKVGAELVPAASDRYFRYYIGENHLLEEDAEEGQLWKVWHHVAV